MTSTLQNQSFHPPPLACHWRKAWPIQRSNLNSKSAKQKESSIWLKKLLCLWNGRCSRHQNLVWYGYQCFECKILWQKDQTYENVMSFHSISSWPSMLNIYFVLAMSPIQLSNIYTSQCGQLASDNVELWWAENRTSRRRHIFHYDVYDSHPSGHSWELPYLGGDTESRGFHGFFTRMYRNKR